MKKRTIALLDNLISCGVLKSYEIVNVSSDNKEGEISLNRNSDRLKLEFPDGNNIIITAITTGMFDDAFLKID